MKRTDPVTIGLVAYGVYQLALGLTMMFAPGWFFDNVGPFGTRNDHYIRDNATMALAFGIGGLVALRLPSWRAPVLAIWTLQAAIHAANHLYDVDRAHPKRNGPVDFALIAASAVVLGWLTWRAAGESRPGPRGGEPTAAPGARLPSPASPGGSTDRQTADGQAARPTSPGRSTP